MRELRVIGVTPDSAHIVCVDTESGQKFRLPADDKLRAAARGDLARFGQIEIEMEATMRPRDIQARIRAGASVEQVTQESGMPLSRVERFAYPVLLERARAAELSQKAHPIRPDGPAVEILIDVVTAAFSARGHTLDNAEWDAWKDEKGFWVAQLQWQNGRSEIAAHWRYQPDSHGGTVSPLDDPATDLIDPDFGRALRGLASILPVEAETPVAPEPVAEPRREPARPAAVDEFYEQRAVAGGTTPIPAAAPIAPGGNRPGGTPALPAATASAPAETYRPPAETYRPPAETYRPPAETYRPPAETHPVPVEPPHQPVARPATAAAPAPREQAVPAAPPPAPVDRTPVETAAVEPEPAKPAPMEPAPVAPAEPAPVETALAEPAPADTAPADTAPAQTAQATPVHTAQLAPAQPAEPAPAPVAAAEPAPEPPAVSAEEPAPAEVSPAPTAAENTGDTVTVSEPVAPEASAPEPETESPEPQPEPATRPAAKKAPAKASKSAPRTKRGKAPMPSWEDVLLGVRSSGH
ncbi:septation protein SepH [Nocardia sp. NPDC024068]|uniref:septation protein SepH n=1 Tax=Nocardia sp. NPDC024068 TaxID=3157197 RepID=UPI0033E395E8